MPLPTSYDESGLAAYMRDGVLKATAVALELTNLGDYLEAVNEVASALGTTIATATDMTQLRAFARREAWRLAMQQSASLYKAVDNGTSDERQQIYVQCKLMFDQAVRDIALLDTAADDGNVAAASSSSVAVPNKAVW